MVVWFCPLKAFVCLCVCGRLCLLICLRACSRVRVCLACLRLRACVSVCAEMVYNAFCRLDLV